MDLSWAMVEKLDYLYSNCCKICMYCKLCTESSYNKKMLVYLLRCCKKSWKPVSDVHKLRAVHPLPSKHRLIRRDRPTKCCVFLKIVIFCQTFLDCDTTQRMRVWKSRGGNISVDHLESP